MQYRIDTFIKTCVVTRFMERFKHHMLRLWAWHQGKSALSPDATLSCDVCYVGIAARAGFAWILNSQFATSIRSLVG